MQRLISIGIALTVLGCSGSGDSSDDATGGPDLLTAQPDATVFPDTVTPVDSGPDTQVTAPDTTAAEDTALVGPDTVDPPADTTATPQDTALTQDTTTPADTATSADTSPPADDTTAPDTQVAGSDMNPGWVGGACSSASDCDSPDYTAAPSCLTSSFPEGFCTQACSQGSVSWLCPDTDYGPGTLNTITRCIETAQGSPTCASECDFLISDTGCRQGYSCVLRQRYGQPDRIYPVCLPSASQGWPGEPAKSFDVGDACTTHADCEHLHCLALPNGYCTKTMCQFTGCPGSSTCYSFDNSDVTSCLESCNGDSQCRQAEGYVCDDFDTCWPDPSSIGWNAAVGPGDCASAWGNGGDGLSPCDTTPDDYVVVNKTARNLAVCNGGNNVTNFWIGLGFAPTGDKQVEGDGKTPEGVFYVAQLIPNSSFYKAWLFSYPDKEDAAWGASQGIISASQKAEIDNAQDSCGRPPQFTGLGGLIELHGSGGKQDWTWGCVAMEDHEVDQLWGVLDVRDTIVVLP